MVWYEHKPTLDRKQCVACHDANASYALLKPAKELCLDCHKEKTRESPRMHGPVAIGDCAFCHEAHKSPHKHLVRAPARKLCFRCHEQTPEGGKTAGCVRTTDATDCAQCHNPHGGKAAFFLVDRPEDARRPEPAPSPSPDEGR